MTTAADILNAINAALVAKWTTRTVYRQAVPQSFERPSFLLEILKENRTRVNEGLYKINSFFTVTVFGTVDEYQRSEASELLDTQIAVMELFESGKLTVGDRSIEISASFGGNNDGEAYVDLQTEYYDARSMGTPTEPLMASLHTNITMEG